MEKPTLEKNGVEVTIKSIKSLKLFDKALQYIVFFPNIYIDGAEKADIINGAKLKRFKNFAAAYMGKGYSADPVPSKLLLGNVLYKCDDYHLCKDARDFLINIFNTGIVIKFEVGELNITPNRENIIYNTNTIRKIEDRIAAAKKELEELIGKKITNDYDDIEAYFKAASDTRYYEPVTDSFTNYCGYKVEPKDLNNCTITFNGLDLKKEIPNLRNIFNMTLPNFKGYIDGDRIIVKSTYYRNNDKIKGTNILILNKGAKLRASVKSFLKNNYNGYGIITHINETEFLEFVRDSRVLPNSISPDKFDLIVGAVYKSLTKKAKTLDLETDTKYLNYKQELADGKMLGPSKDKETIIYEWDTRGFRNKRNFKKFHQAVSYIKGLKKGIILTGMDTDELLYNTLARLKGYAFIKARKDIEADLKKLNLSCIVDLNWLLYKDPMLRIVNTLAKHFPYDMVLGEIEAVNYNLCKEEADEFLRLYRIYKRYKDNTYYYGIVKMGNPGIDPYTEYLCLRLKDYIEKHKNAKSLIDGSGCENSDTIVTAIVMKSKAYKVSYEAYKRVKNNKLIKILCRK